MKGNLMVIGRLNYALGLAGIGVQQFFYPGFRPVFIPLWPESWPEPKLLIYLSSIALMIVGTSIIFNVRARHVSLICGIVFLLLFILVHVPFQLQNTPTVLAAWTDAFKILALSGGAFVVARSFRKSHDKSYRIISTLQKLLPFGPIFFAIMLVVFGIDHFIYAKGVATLVPTWIPGDLFWTYFAGVALVGAGVSIIAKFKLWLVAMLTGIMIFIWFLILHIPRAVAMPELMNGNEITSVFQALAFSGVAFVIASRPEDK